MLDILLTDENEACNNRNVVLEKYTEKLTGWSFAKRGTFTENANKMDVYMNNQKYTVDISSTNNEHITGIVIDSDPFQFDT